MTIPPLCLLPLHILLSAGLLFPVFPLSSFSHFSSLEIRTFSCHKRLFVTPVLRLRLPRPVRMLRSPCAAPVKRAHGQHDAGVAGGCGLFRECPERFLCQWYRVGEKAFKKPHAAWAFCPVPALLRLLLLHKLSAPVFRLSDFFLNARDFLHIHVPSDFYHHAGR